MKKYLRIYIDSEERYVVIGADNIKSTLKINDTQVYISYNSDEGSGAENIRLISSTTDSGTINKDFLIDIMGRLMIKSYTNAYIDVKFPLPISSISLQS